MIGDITYLYLQQEDTASTHGKSAACSGAAVNAGAGLDHSLQRTGVAGSTPVTVTIPAGATEAAWFFETPGTGLTRWPEGIFMVPIEVGPTTSTDIKLEEVYICRVNSAGVNQGTVASVTGLALDLSAAGIVYVQLEAASVTAASATDRLYVVCVFENTDGGSDHDIDLVPSQMIRTPLIIEMVVRVSGSLPPGDERPLPDHYAAGVTDLIGLMPEVLIEIEIEMPVGELETLECDMTQCQVFIDGAPVPGAEIGT